MQKVYICISLSLTQAFAFIQKMKHKKIMKKLIRKNQFSLNLRQRNLLMFTGLSITILTCAIQSFTALFLVLPWIDSQEFSHFYPLDLKSSDIHELDVLNVTTFFDEAAPDFLEQFNIAGMAISVVKDSEIIFSKGYGYADVENQLPVDANATLFYAASVSKNVMATAVMQLVKRGLLDLNADVNNYLTAFKIPDTFPEPITLHHLLTHSAGFADTLFVGSTDSEGKIRTHEEILMTTLPARIRAPGELVSYSNYGSSLAAYIVQEVSGASFTQYIKENIFNPLGMEMSTFEQPIPIELAAQRTKGYIYDQGEFTTRSWQLSVCPGAGGLTSTVTDMAKYIAAHLNDGIYNGTQLLDSSSIKTMHSTQFITHPRLPGVTYGFWEDFVGDYRVIEHDGDSIPNHSRMILIPELNVGIFFSINTYNPLYATIPGEMTLAKNEFSKMFENYFFTQDSEPLSITPVPNFREHVSKFTGDYRLTVMPCASFEKSVYLLAYDRLIYRAIALPNGTLSINGWNFIEIDYNVFQEIGGDIKIAFIEEENGRIVYAYTTLFIGQSLERIEWYESSEVQYFLIFFPLLIFVTVVIGWPTTVVVNKLRKRTSDRFTPITRVIRLTEWLSSLLNLVTAGVYLGWLLNLDFSVIQRDYATLMVIIPTTAFILSILTAILTLVKWWRERNERGEKQEYLSTVRIIHYALFLVASVLFLLSMIFWFLI